jgi:outer membrane protein W
MRGQRISALLLLVTLIALTTSLPVSAAVRREPIHLRVFALWVDPSLDFYRQTGDEVLTADADAAWGLGLSGEYQFTDRVGIELAAFRATPDLNLHNTVSELDLTVHTSDGLAMTPISLGVAVHLLPKSRFDMYITPFIAHISYSDLDFYLNETVVIDGQEVVLQDSIRVTVADDIAYGGVVGLDIPFSARPWAVTLSLRSMSTDLDITDPEGAREKLDFDTAAVTVGLRYTF